MLNSNLRSKTFKIFTQTSKLRKTTSNKFIFQSVSLSDHGVISIFLLVFDLDMWGGAGGGGEYRTFSVIYEHSFLQGIRI